MQRRLSGRVDGADVEQPGAVDLALGVEERAVGDFDADHVGVEMTARQMEQILAAAEADLKDQRALSTEQRRPIGGPRQYPVVQLVHTNNPPPADYPPGIVPDNETAALEPPPAASSRTKY